MICEDDAMLAADLVERVEAGGHTVHGIYGSAREVLANLPLAPPDVAIIDLGLSDGQTGSAVARTLQKAGTRVIIVSGHSNASADLCSIPHTYAAKPVSDELVQHLLEINSTCRADTARRAHAAAELNPAQMPEGLD
jgi:ActR/RegA family two-component response regulator